MRGLQSNGPKNRVQTANRPSEVAPSTCFLHPMDTTPANSELNETGAGARDMGTRLIAMTRLVETTTSASNEPYAGGRSDGVDEHAKYPPADDGKF